MRNEQMETDSLHEENVGEDPPKEGSLQGICPRGSPRNINLEMAQKWSGIVS